jgi:hypothetical protein|nr:MAG TPA: hypothetical protein [Bacteriophage sp.]DAT15711.1 MAG TPA: hypothetical protein [Caudoviricetes sp.]
MLKYQIACHPAGAFSCPFEGGEDNAKAQGRRAEALLNLPAEMRVIFMPKTCCKA